MFLAGIWFQHKKKKKKNWKKRFSVVATRINSPSLHQWDLLFTSWKSFTCEMCLDYNAIPTKIDANKNIVKGKLLLADTS